MESPISGEVCELYKLGLFNDVDFLDVNSEYSLGFEFGQETN